MKKSLLFAVILFSLVCLVACWKMGTATFSTSKDADFYLVHSHGIQTYQWKNGQIELLDSQSLNVAEDVNIWFSGVNMGRYMVLSDGGSKSYVGRENITSIDFQKGKIRKVPTQEYASMGVGYSDQYFYTAQTDTESGKVTVFSPLGEQVHQKRFRGMTTIDGQIFGQQGQVYLKIGFQDPTYKRPDAVFDEYLLILDEKNHWAEKERIHLTSEGKMVEMLSGFALVNHRAYSTVAAIRNTETFEKLPASQLLVLDLASKEKHTIELATISPSYLYSSADGQYLVVKHEEGGKNKLSIVQLADETTRTLDLSEAVEEVDNTIYSIAISPKNHLYVVRGQHLLVYNLADDRLLATVPIKLADEDYPIALRFKDVKE